MLWSIEKLENIIDGKRFKVITDHKAIEAMKKVDFGTRRL